MGIAFLQNALRKSGVQARVRFCTLAEVGAQLSALLPHGRAAVFADEGFARTEEVRTRLKSHDPVCAVVGDGSVGELLALPDEVRAVVALGERSIAAARFFASLRGGYVLAVPLSASAGGLFGALPRGHAQAGYPLRPPDLVLVDASLLGGAPQAVGFGALAALCAEDAALSALFTGGEVPSAFSRTAEALVLHGEGKEGLFCACAAFRLALGSSPAMPAAEAAELGDAFSVFSGFAARYVRFLEQGSPRRYYVPDYVGRVLRAARQSGRRAGELLRNVCVPTAAECARRMEIFAQAREKLRIRGELLRLFARKVRRLYVLHGGQIPCGREAQAAALYECAAELSPLLSVPAMEREFGSLAELPPNAASAAAMRDACG